MNIVRQVTFESANRKKDRSISLRFVTNLEQTTEEFSEMDKLISSSGVLVFSDRGKLTTEEMSQIENVQVKQEGKSKSQRLRNTLYVYWKQQKTDETFDVFYATKMEAIIEQIKNRLENE